MSLGQNAALERLHGLLLGRCCFGSAPGHAVTCWRYWLTAADMDAGLQQVRGSQDSAARRANAVCPRSSGMQLAVPKGLRLRFTLGWRAVDDFAIALQPCSVFAMLSFAEHTATFFVSQ